MHWIIFSLLLCIANGMKSEECTRDGLSRVDLTVPMAESQHCQNKTDNNYLCEFTSNVEVVVEDMSKAAGVEIQGAYKVIVNSKPMPMSILNITDVCFFYADVKAKQSTLNIRNCTSGQVKGVLKQIHISRSHLDLIEMKRIHEIDIIDQSKIDVLSATLRSSQSTFQDSSIQKIKYLKVEKPATFTMRNMFVRKIDEINVETIHKTTITNVTIEDVVQPILRFENLEITKSNISSNSIRCPILEAKSSLITGTYLCKRLIYLDYLSEDGHYMCSDKEPSFHNDYVIFAACVSTLGGIIIILFIYIVCTKIRSKKQKTEKIQQNGFELKKTNFKRKCKQEQKTFEPTETHNTDIESHYCDPKTFVSQMSKSNAIENIVYSDPTEMQAQGNIPGEPDVIYG